MSEAIYADSFQQAFTDELDFLQFLKDREENGTWLTHGTSNIFFHGLDKDSEITEFLKNEFAGTDKENIVDDTLRNTALAAEINGEFYPVRQTAIKTIFERANINGPALRKVSKPVLARILNDCLQVQKGSALVRYSEDKISAVHSGDNSYAVLEIPELFQITGDWIENNFPGYKFSGGTYEHAMATALWEIDDHDDLIKSYTDFLDKHSISHGNISFGLRLTTSDVGIYGANLYPMLFSDSSPNVISLGHSIKTTHRNSANLAAFKEKLDDLFPQLSIAIGKLKELAEVEVNYPLDCMGNILKKIRIPKKMALEALEFFKSTNGTNPCTAHDIYFGICHVVFLTECETNSGLRIADMEENVARALSLLASKRRLADYDVPGSFTW